MVCRVPARRRQLGRGWRPLSGLVPLRNLMSSVGGGRRTRPHMWSVSTIRRSIAGNKSGIPVWDVSAATSWWRWVGHAARLCHLELHRSLADALHWRNVRFLKATMWAPHRDSDAGSMRLGRGHRMVGGRKWDGRIQATVDVVCEPPWAKYALDRAAWRGLELNCLQWVLRRKRRQSRRAVG